MLFSGSLGTIEPVLGGSDLSMEAAMPISNEVRRLMAKWGTGTGWPKKLEWLEIDGVRGWTGQRFNIKSPIMAVVGENGVGKSTVLQCAAAIYRPISKRERGKFASEFFPDTAWEKLSNVNIKYSVTEGDNRHVLSIRKPGERWRGNPERRERHVRYIDLSRIQPVSARAGYLRLAKGQYTEASALAFDKERTDRFSQIMGRPYDLAKMALTNFDATRSIPVISQQNVPYSGFHQGAGETTIVELLQANLPEYSIVLIDEIETSLHPRAQRRLIRDLAERCRELELQVILTTHSPYILDELPFESRAYIVQTGSHRTIMYGVSPQFAMTKMDDIQHAECDLYVEDKKAETLLIEILIKYAPELVLRCRTVPYGPASVGQALGIMASQNRFPIPSCVFLDGDQASALGCINLPGDDAPERVIFGGLSSKDWAKVAERTGRSQSDIADACLQAMVISDHHEWVKYAGTKLFLAGDIFWHALCAEWVENCLKPEDAKKIVQPIQDALIGIKSSISATASFPSETLPLF